MSARKGVLNPRIARPFKVANPSQLGALTYAIPVHALVTSADARAVIDALRPRERRVLSVFAALLRMGRYGYLGTQASYSILAARVASCTRERCGRSTLEAALSGLKAAGLLECAWYAPKGARVVEFEAGRWRTNQIRVWVLTLAGLGLFSRLPKSRGGSVLPFGPGSAEPEKCAVSLPTQKTNPADLSYSPLKTGLTTIDPVLSSCSSDPVAPHAVESPIGDNRESTGAHSAPDCFEGEKSKIDAVCLGPSCASPERPRGQVAATRANARACLLADLWRFLALVPSTVADRCLARASWETSGEFCGAGVACLDWDYWLNRWRSFTRLERLHALRSAIYPALRGVVEVRKKNLPVFPCIGKTAGPLPAAQGPDLSPAGDAVFIADPFLAESMRRAILAAGARLGGVNAEKMKTLAELVTIGAPIDRG